MSRENSFGFHDPKSLAFSSVNCIVPNEKYLNAADKVLFALIFLYPVRYASEMSGTN